MLSQGTEISGFKYSFGEDKSLGKPPDVTESLKEQKEKCLTITDIRAVRADGCPLQKQPQVPQKAKVTMDLVTPLPGMYTGLVCLRP